MHVRAVLCPASALLLVLGVLPATGAMATTRVGGERAGVLQAEPSEIDQARSSGEPVEVLTERSEYTTTWANPDGTHTLDMSPAPLRGRTESGDFAPLDSTLVARADGSVGPRSSAAEVSFSGGGDGADLVSVATDGHSLGLGWRGELPAPDISGDTATYAEVLPGVDLAMTATADGYRQVLVVKTPEAARSEALRKVRFSLASDGLTIQRTNDGGLTARDGDGNTVLTSPPARMWDSATEVAPDLAVPTSRAGAAKRSSSQLAGPKTTEQVPAGAASTPTTTSPVEGPGSGADPAPDPVDAPLPSSVTADVPLAVTPGEVVLTPSVSLLQDPDTVYPVYVDPGIGVDRGDYMLVSTTGENTWRFPKSDNGEGVGRCGSFANCGSGFTTRQIYTFSKAALVGKRVLNATFRIREVWSVSCTPSVIALYRAQGAISTKTEWGTQPPLKDLLVDIKAAAGRGTRCSPEQPARDLEFNDAAAITSGANLTATVAALAKGTYGNSMTLTLRAGDESDQNSWKRFQSAGTLSVNYLPLPGVPTPAGVEPRSDGKASCPASFAAAVTVGDKTPQVQSTVQLAVQPKSNGHKGKLKAVFGMERYDATGKKWDFVWQALSPASATSFVGDGQKQRVTTETLSDGRTYRVHSQTRSFSDNAKSTTNSAWSPWCYFTVDTTAPKPPIITSVGPYVECAADDCPAAGGPGVKGRFTLKPRTGDTGVTGYRWRLTTGETTTAVNGATATIDVTPTVAGRQQLEVSAKDTASRWGPPEYFDFFVALPGQPVGTWSFADAATSTTAADTATVGTRHPLTRATGATFDARGRKGAGLSPHDNAALLDGATGYLATSGPVLNTASSFTVSAWTYLTDASHDGTVLAQGDNDAASSGFMLGYSASSKAWSFGTHRRSTTGTITAARSLSTVGAPATGVWTHLAGVYNGETHQLQLFVNGVPQGSPVAIPVAERLAATQGPLTVGRTNLSQDTYGPYFEGLVDEVQVWQRAATNEDVRDAAALAADAGRSTALVAAWSADSATPTRVPDSSPYARPPLALSSSGATLDAIQQAVTLDGATGFLSAAGPVVDDTGSFTVTTQVTLDATKIAAKADGARSVLVSQRSGVAGKESAWALWFERTDAPGRIGVWKFGRTSVTASGDVDTQVAVASADDATTEGRVQVTGVYDAQAGTLKLYVEDENQPGAPAFVSGRQGAGELSGGRARRADGWTDLLPGSIAEIRVWAGAMTTSQVADQVVGATGAGGTESTDGTDGE